MSELDELDRSATTARKLPLFQRLPFRDILNQSGSCCFLEHVFRPYVIQGWYPKLTGQSYFILLHYVKYDGAKVSVVKGSTNNAALALENIPNF
jgi:hypothetical protein